MIKTTPLIKGLITGIVMVTATIFLFYNDPKGESTLQYSIFILYAAGIGWTIHDYFHSENYVHKFGSIFNQAFRCFIIVVLVMVIYNVVFIKMHPEIVTQSAELYRQDLIKEGNKTPAQMDELVKTAKDQFLMGTVAMTIFGTLLSGSLFGAAGAGFLILRKK